MKEFFKKIDWMIVVLIIGELCNLGGVVTGFINNNPSAAIWAITATVWCAATIAWYMVWKNNV